MSKSIAAFLILTLISCAQKSSLTLSSHSFNQSLQDTCDDPNAPIACSFAGMPALLSNTLTVADRKEAGEELIISGTIFKEDGRTPFPNIIMYAYHTDSKGYYSKSGVERGAQKWHGRLHGWCKTDRNGHYKIQTIRPARYPDNSMPAHIHAAIKKEDGNMYWISDFVFLDDSLVNQRYLSTVTNMVGGTGVVDVHKNPENNWVGRRNIVLSR